MLTFQEAVKYWQTPEAQRQNEKHDDGELLEVESLMEGIMMKQEHTQMRDVFLQIAGLNNSLQMSKILIDPKTVQAGLETTTSAFAEILNQCSFETKGTQNLQLIECPKDFSETTFRHKSSFLTKEDF